LRPPAPLPLPAAGWATIGPAALSLRSSPVNASTNEDPPCTQSFDRAKFRAAPPRRHPDVRGRAPRLRRLILSRQQPPRRRPRPPPPPLRRNLDRPRRPRPLHRRRPRPRGRPRRHHRHRPPHAAQVQEHRHRPPRHHLHPRLPALHPGKLGIVGFISSKLPLAPATILPYAPNIPRVSSCPAPQRSSSRPHLTNRILSARQPAFIQTSEVSVSHQPCVPPQPVPHARPVDAKETSGVSSLNAARPKRPEGFHPELKLAQTPP
jgi:hypothetical protein